jgi:CheY-like chemotaxis protein
MTNGNPPTILVVDDTPDNLKIINGLLKDQYRIRIATGGEKALAIVASDTPPDLILLDIMMPGMDGYQVCQRLKGDPATADIPVIFLTSRTDAEDETEGFRYGAVDYIHKPFDPTILSARVKTQLSLRKALRDAERAQQEADRLLHTVLPKAAAEEIRLCGCVLPRRYDGVGVLFCDLANFTSYCDQHDPEDVVSRLDALFVRFEGIARSHGMEKIKTIGDAFMAAANLLCPNDDPVGSAVRCGHEMQKVTSEFGLGWAARVGVHFGPIIAGVVGQERFQFDIWGDTVNVAARMAARSEFGTVAVTEETWGTISDRFVASSSGRHEVKGKGEILVYQVSS